MRSSNLPQGETYIKSHRFHRRWLKVLLLLSAIVVFCTTYALILPAITMERECQIPEHTHTDACYTQITSTWETTPVCTPETLKIHQHTAACYDADGALVCGYADFVLHTHDANCYDENGNLWCPLPEMQAHQHTDACYVQERGELICGETESEGHTHEDDCYDENGQLICQIPETAGHHHTDACYEQIRRLVCNQQAVDVHHHTSACYDADGKWSCGVLEASAHQHTDACFTEQEVPADTTSLTCTNTDPEHVHGPRCYGTWVLTCGMEEHTHTEACYADAAAAEENESTAAEEASESDETDEADSVVDSIPETDEVQSRNAGKLNVSLLYGDGKLQSEYPNGYGYYTHSTMSGYIKLEPSNMNTDLQDVTVTLSMPKQYVEKSSVHIPEFSTNSASTKYEILQVEEDEGNYTISIHFMTYDRTQTLVLPFTLSFLDDVVPDNYQLPVTASVSGGDTTQPNIYKPLYKDWGITKFVNSNKLSAFGNDGAEAVVTPKEENGNPYLDDLTYVDFAFIVNNYTNNQCNLDDFRDASSVTLTDTLPEYTDVNGTQRIAAFDPEKNPGWTLSEDKKTVSKTYTGDHSEDVLQQIYDDTLHLRFPGLPFNKDQDGNLYADLDNQVDLTAVPSNEAKGEKHPEADDSLRFRLTNDPGAKGEFTKGAMKGNIYDVDVYKTNPYPWGLALSNKKVQPLRHIIIQDRKITDGDETVLEGLDEALKFVRLESNAASSKLPAGKSYSDVVDKVVAYYTDGTTEDYPITEVDSSGNFTVTFNENKICNGYDIIFKDDYEMRANEGVNFTAYTVYRDPENTHVTEGKITYQNAARSVNWYQRGDEKVYVYLKAAHSYDMLPSTESLSVNKLTLYNNGKEPSTGRGGNHVGDYYLYQITLSGSLLEPDVKQYEDLRIVDLLPDGVSYDSIYLIQQDQANSILDGGNQYQPDIEENYHNSGRTAVVFHLNAENLYTNLQSSISHFVSLYFWVKIELDAYPGTVRNYVYVVGDNLDEYTGSVGGAPDIYDLNNNGSTDDQVAYSHSDATIVAAQSIYAEKLIAPAGSDNWSKQGLLVKAGSDFDYLLKIINETGTDYHDLTIYDTLPRAGDQNIFAQNSRGSEFPVHLREGITVPDGYTVLYTTSEDVYQKSMQDMLEEDVWSEAVSDYAAVTAFQIKAVETAVLEKESVFQVRIPVKASETLDAASMAKLHEKTEQDQTSGTATWLEAINSFGFRTKETSAVKESNTVWARIPFAGFCAKKVDGTSGAALSGAEFKLTDKDGKVIGTAVSDADGVFRFRELTEGTYTLTETKVPDGYMDRQLSITVTITQNPVTMEYNISFGDMYSGAGSGADPLCVPNYTTPVLPDTGGSGTVPYTLGGVLLLAAAACLWYIRKKHRKEAQASN